ncbi:hypothetical protein TNCV_2952921 [Trichonephila clavipes]|nr:hypothetical protein TNCV_2952921 [Trichonephila clavipes]
MAIRNDIDDLHGMKTAVWAVYFLLLSSNESPEYGLRLADINAWVLLNSTDKFRGVRVGSMGTTNQLRTWDRKPRLVGENHNNNSSRQDEEPEEGGGRTDVEI